MSASSGSGGAYERGRLIESHLPLVRAIARRYAGQGESLEDLVQVGSVALVRASDRFDPARGVAFATFAAPAVEGEIRRHLAERSGSVRIPRELRRMTGQLERSRARLAATLGRAPTVHELATALGVEQEDIERALEAERAREPSRATPDEAVEAAADAESLESTDDRLLLAEGSHVLDERERRVVFLRFHADMTEREIARTLRMSQSQVSRLLARALSKLREALEHKNLAEGGGDTAGERVISPAEEPSESPVGAILHGKHQPPQAAETRIAAVAASEEQAHPAGAAQAPPTQDLALPYRVTVKPEADAPQSQWIASVEELPGCEARGDSPDQAVENLRSAMETWLSSAVEDPRVVSPQRATRRKGASSPSGRFLVRMPSALHEELTRAAEREQVSLNRFVTARLAASVAPSGSPAPTATPMPASPGIAISADPSSVPSHRRHSFRLLLAVNLAVIILAAAAAITLLVLALQRGI
jgi:RNA polymerase sigma-B factor